MEEIQPYPKKLREEKKGERKQLVSLNFTTSWRGQGRIEAFEVVSKL